METHPKHKYRISEKTGKRLPSKKAISARMIKLQAELSCLEKQLLEHLQTNGATQ